jgi:nucleoside-diphosphate-sugar epimerase
VGSVITQLLLDHHTILTPSRIELDCTDQTSVEKFIESQMPDCVILCAAYTDNTKAETERGNTGGECYRVNVLGTRNIVDACTDIYCLYIYRIGVCGTQKTQDRTPKMISYGTRRFIMVWCHKAWRKTMHIKGDNQTVPSSALQE